MCDVCIFYSKDAESWNDFIKRYLTKAYPGLNILSCNDSHLQTLNDNVDLKQKISHAATTTVIISPALLQLLVNNPSVNFGSLATSCTPEATLLFLCGAERSDFQIPDINGAPVSDRFLDFDSLTIFTHVQHGDLLKMIIELVESPRPEPKQPVHKQEKKKSNGKKICKIFDKLIPNEASCEVGYGLHSTWYYSSDD